MRVLENTILPFLVLIIISNPFNLMCCAQEIGARYLIITHDDYYDAIVPLAEWKTQKGIKSKIVRLSEIGSDSAQIKAYVTNAYNTWQVRPKYLLLVGNKNQIPFPRRGGGEVCHSDNYYTNITGDFRNEILPGRFWVFDTSDAKVIVAKVLAYEKAQSLEDTLWYRKGTTIVREDESPPCSDSVYWADARYAHQLMNDAGFVQVDSLSKSGGHDTTDLLNAINDGRSYILYRGVGGVAWAPPFMLYEADNMQNQYKLPVVISATCATIEGIGMRWLNAGGVDESPDDLKGVVGFYGTTTGLMGAAEMRSALAKGTLQSIFTDSRCTLGKAAEAGRLKYYELFLDSLEYDSWTCLGDPSLDLYVASPSRLDVTHETAIHVGLCSLHVHVEHHGIAVESALTCVWARRDTSVYAVARTDGFGDVILADTFSIPGDTVTVTVTNKNFRPYQKLLRTSFVGGPYVRLNDFSLVDSFGGNSDSIPNPGENIEIPVWLKNWGDTIAYGVSAVIQKAHSDPFFSLSDTFKYFGDIAVFDSVYTFSDGFNAVIAPGCPDTHNIELRLVITDTSDASWISDFGFAIHAPTLLFSDYYFPGMTRCTSPGDTNQLIIEFTNIGSYKAESLIGTIRCSDSFFVVIDSVSYLGTIAPDTLGSNDSNPFIIYACQETPQCHPVDMLLVITAGVYTDTFNMTVYVGAKDFLVWDPDPNHTSGPVIKQLLDSLDFNGDYKVTFPDDSLFLYKSVFVCCGMYPDNYIIRDTSRAALDIERYCAAGNINVYLEGGDVWVADPQYYYGYDFGPLFGIMPWNNSIGYFTGIKGIDGTFAQNMVFVYGGGAESIDWIEPSDSAMAIFRSYNLNRRCGIARNHKTVGMSVELGGLIDTIAPSTKYILVDSIMDYFGIVPTGVKESASMQVKAIPFLSISPNPCRGRMKIMCNISQSEDNEASLSIYDVSGRLVKNMMLSTDKSAGPVTVWWDGRDSHQREVPCGVYFMRLETQDSKIIEKVVVLR
jgi:hypothetical protein